jgi:hypothetical protein
MARKGLKSIKMLAGFGILMYICRKNRKAYEIFGS